MEGTEGQNVTQQISRRPSATLLFKKGEKSVESKQIHFTTRTTCDVFLKVSLGLYERFEQFCLDRRVQADQVLSCAFADGVVSEQTLGSYLDHQGDKDDAVVLAPEAVV